MSNELKPGAFRVWDSQEKVYISETAEQEWAINADGRLMFYKGLLGLSNQVTIYSAEIEFPGRYTVERWTGHMESDMLNGRKREPLFKGDVCLRVVFANSRYFDLGCIDMNPNAYLRCVIIPDHTTKNGDDWRLFPWFRPEKTKGMAGYQMDDVGKSWVFGAAFFRVGTIHDSQDVLQLATEKLVAEFIKASKQEGEEDGANG